MRKTSASIFGGNTQSAEIEGVRKLAIRPIRVTHRKLASVAIARECVSVPLTGQRARTLYCCWRKNAVAETFSAPVHPCVFSRSNPTASK